LDTVAHNLIALQGRGTSVDERRLAHIDDAARELSALLLTADCPVWENDAFISAYRAFTSAAFGDRGAITSAVPAENRARVDASISENAVNSAIFLCSSICEYMRSHGRELSFYDFFSKNADRDPDTRIAYLRSPYSEMAFRVFSGVIKDPSVSYPRDFAGVCEEVYYGRCKYCILPMETSDEGSLSGFRRLTSKYELCPVLSCSVSTANGAQTTRFALFGKSIERLRGKIGDDASKGREVFSFRLDAPTEASLNKTVKALHLYGLRIMNVNSYPVAWDEGRYSFEFSAECDGGMPEAMLLYLTLEIPEYTPIGLYLQIHD